MDIPLLVALFLGTAAAGVTQVVAGTGVRLVVPPLAIFVAGHAEGLRIALVLGLLISVATFLGERRAVAFRAFTGLALPIAISAPLWVLLVGLIPDSAAARLAGLVGVGAVVMTLSRAGSGRLVGRPAAIGVGAAASGLFALGGAGGPALRIYARDNRWPEPRARAVINVCIAIAQVMVLGFMGFPEATKPGFAVGLLGLASGLVLGAMAVKRLPNPPVKLARSAAVALAGAFAAVLLVFGTAL